MCIYIYIYIYETECTENKKKFYYNYICKHTVCYVKMTRYH